MAQVPGIKAPQWSGHEVLGELQVTGFPEKEEAQGRLPGGGSPMGRMWCQVPKVELTSG